MAALLTRDGGAVGLRSAGELGQAGTADSTVDSMPFVTGRFSVFDTWTEIDSSREGRFLERIARGAFTRTMKEDRAHMRILFSHGSDPFIGSRPIASVDGLGEDSSGAWFFGRMFDTIAARELRPLLEAKPPVLGSSFRFTVIGERRVERPAKSDYNPERLPERTITRATIFEFGPTPFPAYHQTTAGTSTGAHPPRSAPRAAPAPAISVDEFVRRLSSSPPETAAERAARQRWLDRVAPLPKGL